MPAMPDRSAHLRPARAGRATGPDRTVDPSGEGYDRAAPGAGCGGWVLRNVLL